jgi:hypothetical protein
MDTTKEELEKQQENLDLGTNIYIDKFYFENISKAYLRDVFENLDNEKLKDIATIIGYVLFNRQYEKIDEDVENE